MTSNNEIEYEKCIKTIKDHIGKFPDFPKKGIVFRDIFTAMTHGNVCQAIKQALLIHIKKTCPDVDIVVGLDARGFLFSLLIASELGIGCVPVRKKGKLPGECYEFEYILEYGTDTFQMQKGSIKPGQKVLLVDDLLATGGSLSAAANLVEQAKGNVVEALVIIELTDLKGREKLKGMNVTSLIQYDD